MDAVRRAEFSEREREIIIKNKFVRRSSCLSLTHCLLLPSYQIQGAFLNSRTAHASLSTPCGTRFVQKSECKPIRRTGQRPPGLRCATMSLCAWIAWLQSTKRVNTLQSSKQRLGGRMDATRPISAAGGGAKAARMLSPDASPKNGKELSSPASAKTLRNSFSLPAIKQGETLIRSESWAASTWISRRRKQPKVPPSQKKTFRNPEMSAMLREVNLLSFGIKWKQHHIAKAWRTWQNLAMALKKAKQQRSQEREQAIEQQRQTSEPEPEVAELLRMGEIRRREQRERAMLKGAAAAALHAERCRAAAVYYAEMKAKAEVAWREGRFADCSELLIACGEVTADNDVLHKFRSRASTKSWDDGLLDAALEDAETAVDLAPSADNKIQLGRTLHRLKRLGAASSELLAASERGADSDLEPSLQGLVADLRRDRAFYSGFAQALHKGRVRVDLNDAPTLRRKRADSRHVTCIITSSDPLDG